MYKAKKTKRVFIDIEYTDSRSLEIQLKKLKHEITCGTESVNEFTQHYKKDLLFSFKQWFVNQHSDFTEKVLDDKTIITIKSRM